MIGIGPVTAQTAPEAWQPAVEARLKAIYDRGEFKPLRVDAEWLTDSSGFTIEDRQRGAGATRVTYDVRTGEPRAVPSPVVPRRDPRMSPDGKRLVEVDGRTLVVRDVARGRALANRALVDLGRRQLGFNNTNALVASPSELAAALAG